MNTRLSVQRTAMRVIAVVVLASVMVLLNADQAAAGGNRRARQRPIEDFLATQGTFDPGLLYVLDTPNFLGWSDPQLEPMFFARVDYAGLANAQLEGVFGTTMRGSVTERPLRDGTALVHVRRPAGPA